MSIGHSTVRCVLIVLLLGLLTACWPATSTSPVVTPNPQPAANDSDITLLLWYGWGGADRLPLSRLVDRFNASHPHGRVLLQSMPLATLASDMRSAIAAGSGPHMAILPNSWLGSLVAGGALGSLDDALPQADLDALLPATLGGARVAGSDGATHLYGVPISFDTLVLYYNAANVLSPPDDTAKLLAAAHGLSSPNATQPMWGLGLNLSLDTTIGYLYAFGGQVFDEQGALALGSSGRAGAEKWLNWLISLNGDIQLRAHAGSGIAIDREIKNGRVLMTFDWTHQMAAYRSLWHENLGVAALPRLSDTGKMPKPYVKSDLLVLNARASAAERAAATEFLRYMTSAEAQTELLRADIPPARRDLKLDGDTAQMVAARALRSQAEQGLPLPNMVNRGIVDEELRIMLERVLMDQASPTDAVTEADERLRDKLKLAKP